MRKRLLVVAPVAIVSSQAGIAHAANGPKAEFPLDVRTKYYPADAAAAHAVVGTDVQVRDLRVAQSSGNAALDEVAATCATQVRYQPATLNGRPVAVAWHERTEWRTHGF
ncbi:MAG: energy transducer TonB [Alphaproteobacteria bacterium]|nr:energy transducer TonB [Alphaproteobacteria bacterium]